MSESLPERASLEWLRKTAKQNLERLRAQGSDAKLADTQRDLARQYGFPSWRALKAHIERSESKVGEEESAAFLRAVGDGDLETVRASLSARPELVNAVGRHPYWGGRPQALHVAIETGRRDMFSLLLDAGADVEGDNAQYDQWSPLMLTASGEREDMRQELLRRGAKVGLVEALLMKDDARVEQELRRGLPDVAPSGGSPLAFARTPFAIDRLLELGAKPDQRDRWGATAIDALSKVEPDGPELVRHLMVRGARPSPEHFARLGDLESLARLAEADRSIVEQPAVILAAVEGRQPDAVKFLLDQGADVDARSDDASRRTLLHSAAWSGNLEMVKLLVSAGGDLEARDSEHRETPLGWARAAIKITRNPKCAEVADFLAVRMDPTSG